MGNQLQDKIEKHWQPQLSLLKCKQTFHVTYYPRGRKNINFLTNNRRYRSMLIASDFTYRFIASATLSGVETL